MKQVLFDGTAIQGTATGTFSGGSDYAKYYLKAFIQKSLRFEIVFFKNRFIDPDISEIIGGSRIPIHYVEDKKGLYHLINNSTFDVFYSALPYEYYDYTCSTQLIGVIHGLRRIECSWDEYRYKFYNNFYKRIAAYCLTKSQLFLCWLKNKNSRNFRRLICLNNAYYITVSEHTKYALLYYFPNILNNIKVIYSPISICVKGLDASHRVCEEQYFLMVNANRFEKNIYRAIMSFDSLISKGYLSDKKIVITGGDKLPYKKEIKNLSSFIFLPYVSNYDLSLLYQNAFCFVYPSLNEGFGYPPLIAMAHKVPVLASSATSIPEACGDAALFFTPRSIDDLSNRILQISYNDSLREELIRRGTKRWSYLIKRQEDDLLKVIDIIFN